MNVQFINGFGAIVQSESSARRFWGEQLGLPLKFAPGSSYTEVALPGLKRNMGLWTVRDAASSIFGDAEWPAGVPQPQANIEFEVDDVAETVAELAQRGLRILQGTKLEPWGQTTARLLSPEGLMIGVVFTPDLRE
jgi:catechol 2,3-dioxygenase-like lactoylglutathione lyase family enzyme